MLKVLEEAEEWTYISTDATLKTCLKLKGQESYRASKRVRNEAPFPDASAWRRLLTVRGRTGAVLLLEPVRTEKCEDIMEAFEKNFSDIAFQQIRYMATDQPSPKLQQWLSARCANFICLCLDPIHLAIVYEYAQWNKKTSGSKMLRALLSKILAVDGGHTYADWGPYFNGSNANPLNKAEESMREKILQCSMSEKQAKTVMADLDVASPFRDRLAFITGIAAICSLKQDEVHRKVTGANKEVFRVLWAACAPDRLEWLWNNVRLRHALSQAQLLFLPSGTSSNEALHAEINAWLRTCNSLHRSTLRLKLQLMQYRKLLTHHVATCYPFARVTSESVVLSRACARPTWTVDGWNEWCDEQGRGGVQMKADLPLVRARDAEAALVHEWVKKKPATSTPRRVRRTPFTAKRQHSLKVGGIKSKSK